MSELKLVKSEVLPSDVLTIPNPHKAFSLYDVRCDMLGNELFKYDLDGRVIDGYAQMLQQIKLTLEVLVAYENIAYDDGAAVNSYPLNLRHAVLYHAGRLRRDGKLIHEQKEAVTASTFLVNICGRVDYVHYDYLFHLWTGAAAA